MVPVCSILFKVAVGHLLLLYIGGRFGSLFLSL